MHASKPCLYQRSGGAKHDERWADGGREQSQCHHHVWMIKRGHERRHPAHRDAHDTKTLADSLAALDKPLSATDVAELEALVPKDAIAGTRYGAEQMAHLDSEK